MCPSTPLSLPIWRFQDDADTVGYCPSTGDSLARLIWGWLQECKHRYSPQLARRQCHQPCANWKWTGSSMVTHIGISESEDLGNARQIRTWNDKFPPKQRAHTTHITREASQRVSTFIVCCCCFATLVRFQDRCYLWRFVRFCKLLCWELFARLFCVAHRSKISTSVDCFYYG